ncbi:hypothetical protein A2U01_0086954, partial [Trifolium medium]|nr:hypothetical protein [Trifolium medium]
RTRSKNVPLFDCLSLDGSSSKGRKSDEDGSFVDKKFSDESDGSFVDEKCLNESDESDVGIFKDSQDDKLFWRKRIKW